MFIKKILIIFITTILFSCSNSAVESQNKVLNDQSIFIKNSQLYFNGKITVSSVNKAFSLIKSHQGEIKSMTVSSVGGDIKAAMRLGIWMYDNNISLTINDICASSCANYFVTAAKSVHINKGAIVGWHGGATQHIVLPNSLPKNLSSSAYQNMQDEVEIEQAFFEHVGVKESITEFGHYNDFSIIKSTPSCVEANDKGEYKGWTYTLNDLKYFGVQNVTSDNKDPPTIYHGKMVTCVVKVE